MANFGLALAVLVACLLAITSAQSYCEYCEGKQCGPNGIGGSCGTCPTGQRCSRGTCICDRGCTGFECGPDNCGTTCGECLPGQTCVSGLCTGACTPQCTRDDGSVRTCGWDRCGGCCGRCPEGFRCRDGTCECYPNCENRHCGPDGCGGECGVCEGPQAFCQTELDPFPFQCAFQCEIIVRVEVREEQTENLVASQCQVSVTGPNGFSAPNQIYPGPNPGFFELNVTETQGGTYTFTTTCPGYQVSTEQRELTTNGQLITLYVDWLAVLIEVRDENTNDLLQTASISITGTGYSLSVNWNSPSYTWNHGGFMTYTFTTSATGYQTRTVQEAVTADTSLIVLFLGIDGIQIIVEECVTGDAVSSATITVSGSTLNYPQQATFLPPNGFTTYTFNTQATGYISNSQSVSVTSTTTEIVLCVTYSPIPVIVTDCGDSSPINGAAVTVTSSTFTSYTTSFTHVTGSTTWTPIGYNAQYTFAGSATGYEASSTTVTVTTSTTQISFCLPISDYCGDGICNGDETATPFQNECRDCGRLRGVISLAVGQKDQLVNITVDVWAAPTNPATFLRQGQPVPTPDFTIISDSKGFFGVNRLSFDAQRDVAAGSASRRFYFRLSGQYTDRTSGNDVITTLLPLWWNYELFNSQWSGSGSLVGTNNSPSLYFYMTPPFSTNDALVRVILSWGTLISSPSASLPDLDLVIAGPVNAQSMETYGSGVVNFDNKDVHASIEGLPYAKIITDQAQGYGPEVFDFYGEPGSGSLNVGFSSEYAPGSEANAYEIWVDRPNSSPNIDSARTFMYDTNSFIVVYINDGTVNEQALFDERTGVEYAFGFYNRDQWNQVPQDATMWHIIDLSLEAQGIVFNGFPGEDGNDKSEQPGCKYSYAGGVFDPTKVFPCGHVAARGVPSNLAYCPFTLTYPQTKRQEN